MLRLPALAVVALACTSCAVFGDDDPTMTGRWTVTEGGDVTMTVTEDEDGVFVGAGTIDYAVTVNVPIEVRGVNAYPSVTMSVIDRNGRTLNFQGGFAREDLITGTMSGYSNGSFDKTFVRE